MRYKGDLWIIFQGKVDNQKMQLLYTPLIQIIIIIKAQPQKVMSILPSSETPINSNNQTFQSYSSFSVQSSTLKKNQIFQDLSQIIKLFEERMKLLLQQKWKQQSPIKNIKEEESTQNGQTQVKVDDKCRTLEPDTCHGSIKKLGKIGNHNLLMSSMLNAEQSQIKEVGEKLIKKYCELEREPQLYESNKKLIWRFISRIKQKIQQYSQYYWSNWSQPSKITEYLEGIITEIKQIQTKDRGITVLIKIILCEIQTKKKTYSLQKIDLGSQNSTSFLIPTSQKINRNTEYSSRSTPKFLETYARDGFKKIAVKNSSNQHKQFDNKKYEYGSGNENAKNSLMPMQNSLKVREVDKSEEIYNCMSLDLVEYRRRKILAIQDYNRSTKLLRDETLTRNKLASNMINRYSKDYANYILVKEYKFKKKRNKSLNSINSQTRFQAEVNKLIEANKKNVEIEYEKNDQNKKSSRNILLEWENEGLVNMQQIRGYREQKTIQDLISLNKLKYKYQKSNLRNHSNLAHQKTFKSIEEQNNCQEDEKQQEKNGLNWKSRGNKLLESDIGENKNAPKNIKLAQIKLKKKSCSASALGILARGEDMEKKQVQGIIIRSKSHNKKHDSQTSKDILTKFMEKVYQPDPKTQNRPLKISKIEVCPIGKNPSIIENNSTESNNYSRMKFEYSSFMKKKNKIKFRNEAILKKCKIQMKTELAQIQKEQERQTNSSQFGFFKKHTGSNFSVKNESKKARDSLKMAVFESFFINGVKHTMNSDGDEGEGYQQPKS